MKLHQDENTGLIVDDKGRIQDSRPAGHHDKPAPAQEQAEALASWARTFEPHYVKDEFHG